MLPVRCEYTFTDIHVLLYFSLIVGRYITLYCCVALPITLLALMILSRNLLNIHLISIKVEGNIYTSLYKHVNTLYISKKHTFNVVFLFIFITVVKFFFDVCIYRSLKRPVCLWKYVFIEYIRVCFGSGRTRRHIVKRGLERP